jgi:predicted dehydrogenase
MVPGAIPTRRTVLRGLGAGAAALALPAVVPSSALGVGGATAPSARITMGLIGAGGRGCYDLNAFLGYKEVQVLAVCDVQAGARGRAKDMVEKKYGRKECAAFSDLRDLIGRADIDAVLVGTPDHWHAIASILAMRAGKDVFCEKPLSLTIAEGREMVRTARRYGRVFSCGSQRVRGDHGRTADLVNGGAIGRIREVRVSTWGPSAPSSLASQPVPAGMDWDLWLGPAPFAPYNANRCSGSGWRHISDYSGGGITDWGAHHFGGVLYAMGLEETGPAEILPPDGRDRKELTFRYADGLLVHHAVVGGPGGIAFVGDEGTLPGSRAAPKRPSTLRNYQGGSLPADFLSCVKTRTRPFQDVEYAHRAATMCHLTNIGYALKRPLKWDPLRERFIGDDEANRLLDRPRREPWRL